MKTKGKHKEKQRTLLKVWLIYSRFLAITLRWISTWHAVYEIISFFIANGFLTDHFSSNIETRAGKSLQQPFTTNIPFSNLFCIAFGMKIRIKVEHSSVRSPELIYYMVEPVK